MADEKLAFPREQILDLYTDHPVREERILKRLDRLGRQCGVGPETRVLDVGCGLGGATRRWAENYGARVLGIDLSPERIRQARHLTELEGLSDRARFEAGDVLELDLPENAFDVVLCQATASHVRAKRELLDVLHGRLVAGGRLALEEPAARSDADLTHPEMERLAELWKVALETVEGWRKLLRHADFHLTLEKDLSDELSAHHEAMLRAVESDRIHPPDRERRAWELALEQTRKGRLAYVRWVGRKPRTAQSPRDEMN